MPSHCCRIYVDLFVATAGVFSVVAGGYKSQGILLVELQERYADWSASSLLWVFSLSSLANKLTGKLAKNNPNQSNSMKYQI